MDDLGLSSRPFEFFVKGKSFFIHRALISKVSVPLDRLINWGMPEAQKSQAVLEGEDDATFARFCHWAYTGLYYAEGFLERPERETLTVEIGDDAPPPDPDISYSPNIRRPKRHSAPWEETQAQPSKQQVLKEAFLKLQFCQPEDERSTWVPRANSGPKEDYTNTFLSHARLYVFAEKFDIQPLKRLILKNLHQTLCIFTLWPECIVEVVALFEYVYSNTVPACNGDEPMRRMLSLYIGYEMQPLLEAAAFRDLLKKDQDLLDDFCSQVERRI